MVIRDEVLRKSLQHWAVTVFAPTDEAIDKNNEWILGREYKVVSYHVSLDFSYLNVLHRLEIPHEFERCIKNSLRPKWKWPPKIIMTFVLKKYSRTPTYFSNEETIRQNGIEVNLVAEKSSFPFKSGTSLPGSPYLYMCLKEGPGGRMEYFANNAKIIRDEEYVSVENSKQLLYIIDEILIPYVSSTSFPPTAFQLLDEPETYDIREPLSAFSTRVKAEGLESIFQREGNYTFFLPVGAGIGHTLNRQQEVDKWVIRGHIVPKKVIFTRLASINSYPSEAYGDDIKVELSIINESNAIGDSYTLHAQSNTIHSDYRHKRGVVLAKILRPNIPVQNGVVHLIESPLMIVDISVWQFLKNEKDGRLSEFLELVNYAPAFKDLLMNNQEKTLFAPSNEAIRQLPPEAVSDIKTNITTITNLLKLHLVMKSISTDDVLYGRHKEYISADNRNSLYFRILGDDRNKTLTVDGVGVKAAAVHSDIGAVDGMVHVIDRLLGMPYQTVYLKLLSDPDLKISGNLSKQDDWGSVLNGNDRRFTFFVPSNEAWAQLKMEMPTEYKQLTLGTFPYHVHKILDRHLVVNRELRSTELERMADIQMVHGHFKIIHGATPIGTITIEWEGLQAHIVRPDVQAVNGVMHVIDRVMMKRRDLTKSESPIGARSSETVLLALVFAWVLVWLATF